MDHYRYSTVGVPFRQEPYYICMPHGQVPGHAQTRASATPSESDAGEAEPSSSVNPLSPYLLEDKATRRRPMLPTVRASSRGDGRVEVPSGLHFDRRGEPGVVRRRPRRRATPAAQCETAGTPQPPGRRSRPPRPALGSKGTLGVDRQRPCFQPLQVPEYAPGRRRDHLRRRQAGVRAEHELLDIPGVLPKGTVVEAHGRAVGEDVPPVPLQQYADRPPDAGHGQLIGQGLTARSSSTARSGFSARMRWSPVQKP